MDPVLQKLSRTAENYAKQKAISFEKTAKESFKIKAEIKDKPFPILSKNRFQQHSFSSESLLLQIILLVAEIET